MVQNLLFKQMFPMARANLAAKKEETASLLTPVAPPYATDLNIIENIRAQNKKTKKKKGTEASLLYGSTAAPKTTSNSLLGSW